MLEQYIPLLFSALRSMVELFEAERLGGRKKRANVLATGSVPIQADRIMRMRISGKGKCELTASLADNDEKSLSSLSLFLSLAKRTTRTIYQGLPPLVK